MHDHVDHPERRHPCPDPLQRRMPGAADGHQGEGDQRQGQQVDVVGFQRPQVRLMVRAVQEPAPAMHDVAMCQVANALHGRQGAEKNSKVEDHGDIYRLVGTNGQEPTILTRPAGGISSRYWRTVTVAVVPARRLSLPA
ncbi:hypothetical protein D3C80_1309710 [compost metagenome]